jgi:hypothetical protein
MVVAAVAAAVAAADVTAYSIPSAAVHQEATTPQFAETPQAHAVSAVGCSPDAAHQCRTQRAVAAYFGFSDELRYSSSATE